LGSRLLLAARGAAGGRRADGGGDHALALPEPRAPLGRPRVAARADVPAASGEGSLDRRGRFARGRMRRRRDRRLEPRRPPGGRRGRDLMDLRDSPDEAAFGEEVRGWIEANLPDELRAGRGGAADRRWSRALSDAGYAGLAWPREYGGGGAPYSHQAIVLEEL